MHLPQALVGAALLLLALFALRLSCALAREPPPCGAASDAGCAPEPHASAAAATLPLDVLSVAAAPGCVAAAAVASLNRFVAPRRIVLLARSAAVCAKLGRLAANVQCVPEDEAVPGACAGLRAVRTRHAREKSARLTRPLPPHACARTHAHAHRHHPRRRRRAAAQPLRRVCPCLRACCAPHTRLHTC
jgi:hypothetical protein